MFSVIIPLYNKEKSIFNTLNSVLDQTFFDFEIVIVNDGSTDKSLEVVQQFTDPRIKIVNKTNDGVSSARNRGIEEASNEWIAFLDGDDLWKENHLEEYNKAIKENPQLNWLFSGYTSKNNLKEYHFVYSKSGVFDNVIEDLLKGIKIHTSTVCVRKSLFEEYQDLYFTVGINNSEDREVWYKLCCIDQSPYYIRESLSIYTLDNENSLTKTRNLQFHFLTMENRLKSFFKHIDKKNELLFRKYIKNYNINLIKGNYINNKFHNEFKLYLTSLQFLIYSTTLRFPNLFKKIITKIL